jgi:hypothetical protein
MLPYIDHVLLDTRAWECCHASRLITVIGQPIRLPAPSFRHEQNSVWLCTNAWHDIHFAATTHRCMHLDAKRTSWTACHCAQAAFDDGNGMRSTRFGCKQCQIHQMCDTFTLHQSSQNASVESAAHPRMTVHSCPGIRLALRLALGALTPVVN